MDEYQTTRRARAPSRSGPIVVILAFLVGAALAAYGVWRFADRIPGFAPEPARASVASLPAPASPAPSAPASVAAQQAVAAAQIVAEQQGGLDQRIAAAEQRIARLDLQAQAASGNAVRAEGLLIAFSARRTLDRGSNLGPLGDQLRLRFGDVMPNAVETLIAFGRQPVTVDQLTAKLDGLAPALAQNDRGMSWDRLTAEFGQLFVVRHETTPSPQPRLRLERARMFLRSGRVSPAIAEVRNLPGAANAAAWIRDAERYAAAQDALDRIETAAVFEPRRLRDGEGQPIEQAGAAITPPAVASAAQ